VPRGTEAPEDLGLYQNAPNPFAGSTTIQYALPSAGHARLAIFDVTGRLVTVLVDEEQSAGVRTATWDGTDSEGNELPSGIYFYSLTAANQMRTMKMLRLK